MSEISEDHSNLSPWRKKFLANRMTFESILFEKELLGPKTDKLSKGLLVLGGIWLFHALLLAQWAFRRGYFFNQADAESFGGVLRYAAYLETQGFWALLKPEFSDLTLNPPLYYLAYVPVLKYLTTDLNLALVIVNSFFLLVLALAVFLAVRRSRPNSAGWLGAAFALAFPFVLETARRPAPEMALMAMAAALYACYIRSDDFEKPKWSFAFAICMGLGFFSHRFFWLYALPLLPFLLSGVASPFSREEMLKGFLPGMIINLPWYLFTLAAVAAGLVPLSGEYLGFWHYFKLGASAAGLPLFVLGLTGLTWMYYSVFMPYEKKKTVAGWFWAPYLLLAWVVRGSSPELLYPALLPFAVAVPVMTPHKVRKYLLVFVLVLGGVNQSGLVRPFPAGKYPWAGLPLPPSGDYRSAELMALVQSNTPAEGGLAGVYGDANLNAGALRFAASKSAGPVKFADSPACPGCAFVLIHKTPRFGETPSQVEKTFAALKGEAWFPGLFEKKAELELADSSKAEVYVRTPPSGKFLGEGAHEVRNLSLGALKIEEATLNLSGFDPATGVYSKAELFAPAAAILGGDIYGLTLDIRGLSAGSASLNPFVPAGVSAIRVRSAKITEYAVERYLADRCPFLSDIKIDLAAGSLSISALARGHKVEAEFALSIKNGGVLEAKPLSFQFGLLGLNSSMLKLFTFRLDFSDNPYGLKISGLRVNKNMLELY